MKLLPSCRTLQFIYILHAFGWTVHGLGADSFLSDRLVRKGQVQNVLEHTPARSPPSCENSEVCQFEVVRLDLKALPRVVDRTDRNDALQL